MSAADLPAVESILNRTSLFPAEMLGDMAGPFLGGEAEHTWLVIAGNGVIDGFAYCEAERMAQGAYNLLAIAVLPDRQGNGLGRSLVEHLERLLAAKDGRVLIVETSSLDDYASTRRFYELQGFAREAEIRDFYAPGENKIVFWKRL